MPKPPKAPRGEVQREPDGRFVRGTPSLNPGGLSKTHREYREAFLHRVPRALKLLDDWMDPDATDVDPEDRRFAVQETLARGLGKHVKPSELPVLVPVGVLEANAQDTAGLLVEVRALLAAGLASLKGQQAAGDLAPDSLALLGRAGQDLGNLLKTEAEAARASKLGALSVDELLEIVCQHVPVEQVGAALKRRLDNQEGKS